jgi:hypothetical protein
MLGRLARDRRPLEARVLGFSFDCRQQLLDLGVCNEKVQLLDDLHLGFCPGSGGVCVAPPNARRAPLCLSPVVHSPSCPCEQTTLNFGEQGGGG